MDGPKPFELEIRLPRELKSDDDDQGTIKFTPKDFNLTWMQFLEKHKPDLPLEADFAVADTRPSNARVFWDLTELVKEFINSFHYTKKRYIMQVANKHTSKMDVKMGPRRQASSEDDQQVGPSTGHCPSRAAMNRTKRPATHSGSEPVVKFTRQELEQDTSLGNGALSVRRGPPPPAPKFTNIIRDDIASQAISTADTLDSQLDDLLQSGIENKKIKDDVMRTIHVEVNNSTMLRIRHELQRVMDSGKWLSFTHRVPVTANALQLIFKLGKTFSGGQD